MSFPLRRLSLTFLTSLLVAGCSGTIREDRTIAFAPDGKQVAFQHGREGIFVVETDGAAPTKIFQPDADVLATSTPLWSPTDRRLIFTTARRADKNQHGPAGLPAEEDPAGNLYTAQPITYTCWLREEPKAGQPLVVPIFTAPCDNPGYVAANLAVRWHPDGKHILYVRQVDKNQHGLFEFDLQSKSSRPVFPHKGGAFLFDWAPDNVHLVCLLGDVGGGTQTAGIWVGKLGDDHWWHVPESALQGWGDLNSVRAIRPVWSRDANHFAFVSTCLGSGETPVLRTLHRVTLATHNVEKVTSSDKPIRDIHWRPDGSRLGYLCGEETGIVHLTDTATLHDRTLAGEELCDFLGWDVDGEQLAFVARQPLPCDPAKSWAFLLLPDVRARNCVLVGPDVDPSRTDTVFSGLQVTFPHWSPTEARLSLWATYRPTYRSLLSHLLDLGGTPQDPLRGLMLRPGDPALVLDPATGERKWKAIDAHEKMQIGHYHLLRREYAEAWHWYEQAATGEPDGGDRSPQQFVRRFVRGRDGLFFQAYCLDKLGRDEEAHAKRRLFDETFLPDMAPQPQAPAVGAVAPFGAADLQPTKEQLRHWRDLYVAEVFLSLDAIEDGERFFRAGLAVAQSDEDRLSKSLVLTQFLLMRNKNAEYAELATDTVLPLLLHAWKPRKQTNAAQPQLANLVLAYSDGLSLLPLFAPEFLAGLSEKQVRDLVPRWRKLRPTADDDVKRLGIDLFLEAAAVRLGQKDEQQTVAGRVAANPVRGEILGDKGVSGMIEGVRGAPEAFEMMRQMRRN